MITVKLAPYKKEEIQALQECFIEAEVMFKEIHCKSENCSDCPYRVVCYDITSVSEYLTRKIEGV